jgi:hypothetical protein
MTNYRITPAGIDLTPDKPHNVAAWGAVKELLRIKNGQASEDELSEVLNNCYKRGLKNGGYLGYAVKKGWIKSIP